MKDLVNVIADGRDNNLTEQGIKKLTSIEVLKELKQMSEKDFLSCFASASINKDTLSYEIVLRFPAVSNER